MMTFGAALSTSNGFSVVQHNHQEIDNDGHYVSEIKDGTDKLADWQFEYQWYGASATGARAGFAPQPKNTRETL